MIRTLNVKAKYNGSGAYYCTLYASVKYIHGDIIDEGYSKINNSSEQYYSIASLIDKYDVEKVDSGNDYLIDLVANSYLGIEFTYDYSVEDAKRYYECSYYSYGIGRSNRTYLANTFDIFVEHDKGVYLNPTDNTKYRYPMNSPKYIKYAQTLLANIENNLEFLKEMDNRPDRYQPEECVNLANIISRSILVAAQDEENFTHDKINHYIDMLYNILKISGNYTISDKLRLISGYSYRYEYDKLEFEKFNLNKYALHKIMNCDIQSALALKSKCPVSRIDDILFSFINNALTNEAIKQKVSVARYVKTPSYVLDFSKNIDKSFIDFSLIDNFDKFIDLAVRKNLKRNSSFAPFYFGYLLYKDKFPWDKFEEQRILNIIPSFNEEKKEDIPGKDLKYISRFACSTERELISAFTYLNILDKDILNKYLDKITYNFFKMLLKANKTKVSETLKHAIYVEDNLDKEYWWWSVEVKEENMANSENVKILFNNLVKYYDEHATNLQIKKLIEILNETLPSGFIDQNVSKKYKKLKMEMKISDKN